SYVLAATVRRKGGIPEEARMPITLGLQDLTGIMVVTSKAPMIAGRVVDEDGSVPPQSDRVRVLAHSTEGAGIAGDAAKDGTFLLPLTLGHWAFEIVGLPDGLMLKSIELNGTDVTDVVTEFTGNQRETTARVIVTAGATEVTGRVSFRSGQPASDVNVVVF